MDEYEDLLIFINYKYHYDNSTGILLYSFITEIYIAPLQGYYSEAYILHTLPYQSMIMQYRPTIRITLYRPVQMIPM